MKKTKHESYPISPTITKQMLEGLDYRYSDNILVVTGGNGNFVHEIKKSQAFFGSKDENIDVIESDPALRHMLEEQGIRVVHDDILAFYTLIRYDWIIMASISSDGDAQLMKSLDLLKPGGKCVCLLNAELSRNSHTKLHQLLEKRLLEWHFNQVLIPEALTIDKQKANAAIVKVTRPEDVGLTSILLEKIKWDMREEEEKTANKKPVINNPVIQSMIHNCQLDQKAGLALMREYEAIRPFLTNFIPFNDQEHTGEPLVKLDHNPNKFIQGIRKKYWQHLFVTPKVVERLPSAPKHKLHGCINEMRHHDFTETNILAFQSKLQQQMMDWIAEEILDLFREISGVYYSNTKPNSANTVPFTGYRTDLAWKIKPKVALSWRGIRDSSHGEIRYDRHAAEKLCEAEALFDLLIENKLDGSICSTGESLNRAERYVITRNITLRYLKVTFFKKGTTHLEFLDSDVLEQLNIFACRQKGWLPPDYGKTAYEDLDTEARSVVDSFQGEAAYRAVCSRNDLFENRLEAMSLFTLPECPVEILSVAPGTFSIQERWSQQRLLRSGSNRNV